MKVLEESFPFIPETHLFYSRKKADRFIRERVDKIPRFIGSSAQTWCDGGVAVVLMSCESDWSTELALLCHEAYHVVSMHYGYLGEESPSDEFVAYGIQVVAKALFEAHTRRRGGWER